MVDALILLLVANGTPVLAFRVLGHRFGYPVDGNRLAPDGNPWLGNSKSYLGVASAVIATSIAAQLLGWGWMLGGAFAALSMSGDLASSFIKRRLGLSPGTQAPGLDQVPEALLPLMVCAGALGLQWLQQLILVAVFLVLDLLLTPLLPNPRQQHPD